MLVVLHSFFVTILSIISVVVGLSSTKSIRSIAVFARLITSSGGGSVHPHSSMHSTRDFFIGWRIVDILVDSSGKQLSIFNELNQPKTCGKRSRKSSACTQSGVTEIRAIWLV